MQNCRILFFLVFCLLCSGCASHTVTNHLAQAQSHISHERQNNTQNTQDSMRATALETVLQSLDGVTDCCVLIDGQTAIIGLHTNADTMQAHQNLTAQAQDLALQTDAQLRIISVTTSDKIVQRIEAYKAAKI